jgi:hypothetical protein
MDIKDFKAGSYRKGYEYHYFLPEKINHSFFWTRQWQNRTIAHYPLSGIKRYFGQTPLISLRIF